MASRKPKTRDADIESSLSERRADLADAVSEIALARQSAPSAKALSARLARQRWVVVDEFQVDGVSYLVARTCAPHASELSDLAPRERQVLALAAKGERNKVIAYELGLDASTVRVLMLRAARKLGTKSRRETIAKFEQLAKRR